MRRAADSVMRSFARLLVHLFFRRIEVENSAGVPASGPLIVVANHLNGLVDGLLLMAMLRRYPRFLGKSTLFRVAPLWPFLKLAGVVPVYRAIDGADTPANAASFARSRELLAGGGVIGVFPEGVSHNDPTPRPLRTGAARIALTAAYDSHVEGLILVPVGLIYDEKARFRSRALLRVGAPIPIEPLVGAYRADERGTVRSLTDAIAAGLAEVSPDYASWSEAATLAGIAEIAIAAGRATPTDVELGERDELARRLGEVAPADPNRASLGALRVAFDDYQRDLALLGVTDHEIGQASSTADWRRSSVRSLLEVLAAMPLAVVGTAVHIVPYQLMKLIAARPENESIKSTVKVIGCFFLFTAVYVTLAVLSAGPLGLGPALGVLVGCPICGYVTVRFAERVHRVGGYLAALRKLRRRGAVVASVLDRRERVAEQARRLLETS